MKPGIHIQKAERYCRDVSEDRLPACKWIKLVCQRYLNDLAEAAEPESKYIFSEAKAERACKFLEKLPHTKGRWRQRRELLKLQGYQCFIVCALFGFLHRDSGLRRYRELLLMLPRKNGKSLLAAGIAIYMLVADGEAAPEVYTGATTQRQAMEVFTPAKQMTRIQPALKTAFGLTAWAMAIVLEAGGKMMPVVRDPGEGQSPSCYVLDEVHQHPDDTLINTFRTGCGSREQPLGIFISTAGNDLSSPCFAMVEEAHNVLSGTIDKPELLAVLFGIDVGDDWTTEAALIKANPGWGVSIYPEYLRQQQKAAIASARLTNSFLTRHLNEWVGVETAFFNLEAWTGLGNPELKESEFAGCPCYMGVAMASKVDLAATCKVFFREEAGKMTYAAFPRFYLPEDRANDSAFPSYAGWVHDDWITATPGSMVSQKRIVDDIIADVKEFHIEQIAWTEWNSVSSLERVAEETQATNTTLQQTARFLSEPAKTLEALILAGCIVHNGNPVLKWNIGNTAVKVDGNDNVKPIKGRDPNAKIDGTLALIMALSRALVNTQTIEATVF